MSLRIFCFRFCIRSVRRRFSDSCRDSEGEKQYASGSRCKKGAKTFPSGEPRIEIDYLATRGLEFDPAPLCLVHEEKVASDHRPIHAALPVPAPEAP